MFKDILSSLARQLRPALSMLVALSVLTGLIYPSAITLAAKALFPHQALGSLIEADGAVTGSELIGQQFTDPGRFWSRPSATTPQPYNAQASGGSNLAPAGEAQLKAVTERAAALHAADPGNALPLPADLLTASASGLDPHISPAAALYQAGRVAKARGVDEARVRQLVANRTQARQLGFLGQPRVNVLLLNRDLDSLAQSAHNAQTKP